MYALTSTRIEGEIITVEIGKAHTLKQFHIHKALLVKRSAYFSRVFNRSGKQRPVSIPSFKVATFDLYVQYIYSGHLSCRNETSESEDYEDLVELYILAQRLENPTAMDAAISAMLFLHDHDLVDGKSDDVLPSWRSIERAYKATKPESQLRRVLVDIMS